MLRKFIGVLMLILLYGSPFVVVVYYYSIYTALIIYGVILGLLAFIYVAIWLING